MGRDPASPPSQDPRIARPPDPQESGLVEGLIAGDHDAISAFLERTHHPVFCMACRLSADPDLRRDWAHDTLLGIIEDLEKGRFVYRGPGSFWGWFRKRAYFRLLDAFRRHRRRAEREHAAGTGIGDGLEGLDLAAFAGNEDIEGEIERTEVLAAIEACLAKLQSDSQRGALRRLLFEEMPYEEIARSMATPLNTVRAWIRRGRLALRKCLVTTLEIGAPSGGSESPDA